MPPKQRHYEPIVESVHDPFRDRTYTTPEMPTVRALDIPLAGHWLYADDVVDLLRAYAGVVGGEAAEALTDVADTWDRPKRDSSDTAEPTRVELYPDASGKWIARSVDIKGRVQEWLEGDFNIRNVELQIEQRWPGLPIYQLQSENDDSTWEGLGPSPRLWRNT